MSVSVSFLSSWQERFYDILENYRVSGLDRGRNRQFKNIKPLIIVVGNDDKLFEQDHLFRREGAWSNVPDAFAIEGRCLPPRELD